MKSKLKTRYKLAPGSRVREENFGLLFYTMAGPHLYFLNCGGLLDRGFFDGELALGTWIHHHRGGSAAPEALTLCLVNSLHQLKEKGVIIEC